MAKLELNLKAKENVMRQRRNARANELRRIHRAIKLDKTFMWPGMMSFQTWLADYPSLKKRYKISFKEDNWALHVTFEEV